MRERKEINVQIGANIQTAREAAHLTQEGLSELLGITPNHLSAIERGVSGVSLETLQKLCKLLPISADYILFGESTPEGEYAEMTQQLSRINPKHKANLGKILSAVAEIAADSE